MTREELFQSWINIDGLEQKFYKALDKYYDRRLIIEAQGFLNIIKKFMKVD